MKPKPEKKEFVVPLIRKNVWRTPAGRRKEGTGRELGGERTEEEKALEREAAEAIMRGMGVTTVP